MNKLLTVIIVLNFYNCGIGIDPDNSAMKDSLEFTDRDVLITLDDSVKPSPYVFFPYMDDPYFALSGNRITLLADDTRWAIVFEKTGYANGGLDVEIELNYFGNCLLNLDTIKNRSGLVTNTKWLVIIKQEELERIAKLDSKELSYIVIRDDTLRFDKDEIASFFDAKSIHNLVNHQDLISFIRFIDHGNSNFFRASNAELRNCLPQDLPVLMTLNEWHHKEYYFLPPRKIGSKPSTYETFQMLAKVLATRDTTVYNPTLKPNNHWSNWPGAGSQ